MSVADATVEGGAPGGASGPVERTEKSGDGKSGDYNHNKKSSFAYNLVHPISCLRCKSILKSSFVSYTFS